MGKVLIELTPEQERRLRSMAERNGESLARAAGRVLTLGLLAQEPVPEKHTYRAESTIDTGG